MIKKLISIVLIMTIILGTVVAVEAVANANGVGKLSAEEANATVDMDKTSVAEAPTVTDAGEISAADAVDSVEDDGNTASLQQDELQSWIDLDIDQALDMGLIPDSIRDRLDSTITQAELYEMAALIFESIKQFPIEEFFSESAQSISREDAAVLFFKSIKQIPIEESFSESDQSVLREDAATLFIESKKQIPIEESFSESDQSVSREDAAVLFAEFMQLLEHPLRFGWPTFADASDISEESRISVGQVCELGIMTGDSEDLFNPTDELTVEQTIDAMLAIYNIVMAPEPEKISINSPLAAGRKIPILMYHAIADVPTTSLTSLFVRPSELEAQLRYLAENGYQSITFEDLDNIGAFTKPVMLTFDDGYLDNYTILFPLLKKYNIRATIFVITQTVWSKNFLSQENIVEMSNSGLVSIQSHTASHNTLPSLKREALETELDSSKTFIEDLTGKPVVALAYPVGSTNSTVRAATSVHYTYAVLADGGKYTCGVKDTTAMNRVRINRGISVKTFASLIG